MVEQDGRIRRHRRVRVRVIGTKDRPRLSVFRSHRAIYAQLIDDEKGQTLLGMREPSLEKPKTQRAQALGKALARVAVKKGIKKVVFDRGGYTYHGRIAAFAQGAREGGLVF